MSKFFLILVLSISISTQVFAVNSCGSILSYSKWKTPEMLGAIELIAAAEIATVMRKPSYNPLSPWLPGDRHSDPLRKIGARNYSNQPDLLFNDRDYSNARMEALKHLTGPYAFNFLDQDHIKLHLPIIAQFLGKDFLHKLDRLKWDYAIEMREFVRDNIDAIIANAVNFPRSGRLKRLAHATKLAGAHYTIPGVCVAAGCFIGAAAIASAGSAIGEATDSFGIEMTGLFGALALGKLGLFAGAFGVGMGTILTPLAYLESRSTPGHEFGLYDHEIGRTIRDQYRNR